MASAKLQKIYSTAIKFIQILFNNMGLDLFTCARIIAIDRERIGTNYGGWIIPKNEINSDSICYCAGAGEDISFDIGLIKRYSCDVYIFDPTPKAIMHLHKLRKSLESNRKMMINNNPSLFYDIPLREFIERVHYFKLGLWDRQTKMKFYCPGSTAHASYSILNLAGTEEYVESSVDRLQNIMNTHDHKKIDLLKLDIEGAEYKVIDSILDDKLDIQIICVEFDEIGNPLNVMFIWRIRKSLQKLLKFGYRIIAIESGCNFTLIKQKDSH